MKLFEIEGYFDIHMEEFLFALEEFALYRRSDDKKAAAQALARSAEHAAILTELRTILTKASNQ